MDFTINKHAYISTLHIHTLHEAAVLRQVRNTCITILTKYFFIIGLYLQRIACQKMLLQLNQWILVRMHLRSGGAVNFQYMNGLVTLPEQEAMASMAPAGFFAGRCKARDFWCTSVPTPAAVAWPEFEFGVQITSPPFRSFLPLLPFLSQPTLILPLPSPHSPLSQSIVLPPFLIPFAHSPSTSPLCCLTRVRRNNPRKKLNFKTHKGEFQHTLDVEFNTVVYELYCPLTLKISACLQSFHVTRSSLGS